MQDESANPPASNLPAVITEAMQTVPLSQIMAGPRADYWASWPVATIADRVTVHNARNKDAVQLDTVMGQTLMIRGVIAHLASVEDKESGEVQELVRCVLIGADGTCYSCCSMGVRESVRDLMSNFGEGPWEPPLPLIPHTGKTRQGFRVFKLEVDASFLNAAAAPAPEKPARAKPK